MCYYLLYLRVGYLCFQPKTFRPKNFILAQCPKYITFRARPPRLICLGGTFPPHIDESPPVLFYLVSALICHNPQVCRRRSFICQPCDKHYSSIIWRWIRRFSCILKWRWIWIGNACWPRAVACDSSHEIPDIQEHDTSYTCFFQEEKAPEEKEGCGNKRWSREETFNFFRPRRIAVCCDGIYEG